MLLLICSTPAQVLYLCSLTSIFHRKLVALTRFVKMHLSSSGRLTSFDEMQVDSLEAVAKARCILGMAAQYLYMSCVNDDEKWPQRETQVAMELFFDTVKALCSLGPTDSKSPALFLFKQLFQRYGRRTCHRYFASKATTFLDRSHRSQTKVGVLSG